MVRRSSIVTARIYRAWCRYRNAAAAWNPFSALITMDSAGQVAQPHRARLHPHLRITNERTWTNGRLPGRLARSAGSSSPRQSGHGPSRAPRWRIRRDVTGCLRYLRCAAISGRFLPGNPPLHQTRRASKLHADRPPKPRGPHCSDVRIVGYHVARGLNAQTRPVDPSQDGGAGAGGRATIDGSSRGAPQGVGLISTPSAGHAAAMCKLAGHWATSMPCESADCCWSR